MLTLYYKPTCVFSQRVLGEAEELGVSFNLKDVTDAVLLTELFDIGGKSTVPFLVDEERGVAMYDSNEIISHLQQYYRGGNASGVFEGVRVHRNDNVCDTCQ